MAKKELSVKFGLIGINTEEFAQFDENFDDSKNIENKLKFGFDIDESKKLILGIYEIQAFSGETIILKGKFNFAFRIADESWEDLKNGENLVVPKGFITHLSVIAVGAIRGIFHEKLHKLSSPLSNYIFPLVNISQIINEDFKFKLEN